MELFKSIDSKLLKQNPLSWIYGLHIFPPLIIVCIVLFWLFGFASPVDPEMPYWKIEESVSVLSLLATLISITLLVLFFLRQSRFNKARIHHSLPYQNVIKNFIAFILIIAGIILIRFAPTLGLLYKVQSVSLETGFPAKWGPLMFYQRDEFWKIVIAIIVFLTIVLQIICSTSNSDFGWSMLIVALSAPAFSIVLAIGYLLIGIKGEDMLGWPILLTILFMGTYIYFGFIDRDIMRKKLRRSFGIAAHIVLPGAVVALFLLTSFSVGDWSSVKEEGLFEFSYFLGVGTAILSFFVFNLLYQKKYIDPY